MLAEGDFIERLQLTPDPYDLSIVCHVGVHVHLSFMIISLDP